MRGSKARMEAKLSENPSAGMTEVISGLQEQERQTTVKNRVGCPLHPKKVLFCGLRAIRSDRFRTNCELHEARSRLSAPLTRPCERGLLRPFSLDCEARGAPRSAG
jgi:hypothetical protein